MGNINQPDQPNTQRSAISRGMSQAAIVAGLMAAAAAIVLNQGKGESNTPSPVVKQAEGGFGIVFEPTLGYAPESLAAIKAGVSEDLALFRRILPQELLTGYGPQNLTLDQIGISILFVDAVDKFFERAGQSGQLGHSIGGHAAATALRFNETNYGLIIAHRDLHSRGSFLVTLLHELTHIKLGHLEHPAVDEAGWRAQEREVYARLETYGQKFLASIASLSKLLGAQGSEQLRRELAEELEKERSLATHFR